MKNLSDVPVSVLHCVRKPLQAVIFFSIFSNLLLLTVPIYMLQMFDRVLSSRSYETLVMLTIVAGGLLVVQAVLENLRSRLLVRIGARLELKLRDPVVAMQFNGAFAGSRENVGSLSDLSDLRAFITGPGLLAIIDSPWVPVYVAVIFLLHPVLGWVAVAGAILLFLLALANDITTRVPLAANRQANDRLSGSVVGALRNAEVVRGMRMLAPLKDRWRKASLAALAPAGLAADRMAAVSATAKFIRQAIQIAMLASGVALVVEQKITAGMMIAGSILLARALAPVESAIGSWRTAVTARGALSRLNATLSDMRKLSRSPAVSLPAPAGAVVVENVRYVHPGANQPFLREISLLLRPGEALGIVGPSGGGKSTLVRLLAGVMSPTGGAIRLDGAILDHWGDDLGKHIGYLPQTPQLFAGTIWENIARMDESAPSSSVIAATRRAGLHDYILRFPNGYETNVGEGGANLSGGQQRLIALARCLYGDPKLVILDEPTANLDAAGEQVVRQAITSALESGCSVVIVSHQVSLLNNVDKLLLMRNGLIERYGPRELVVRALEEERLRQTGGNVQSLSEKPRQESNQGTPHE